MASSQKCTVCGRVLWQNVDKIQYCDQCRGTVCVDCFLTINKAKVCVTCVEERKKTARRGRK